MGSKFTSYLKSIESDLRKSQKRALKRAALHLKKKVREKLRNVSPSAPGQPPGKVSGDLLKGIGTKSLKDSELIGAGPPAQHAHLLEFGTKDRTVKKSGKMVGHVKPRPFLGPTFEAEAENVKEILSEKWL